MNSLLQLITSDVDDIDDKNVDSAFSLYNQLNFKPLWFTMTKTNRKAVLVFLREWWSKLSQYLRLDNHRYVPREHYIDLWVANNTFTDVKEGSPSCSSCRARMFRRLKTIATK